MYVLCVCVCLCMCTSTMRMYMCVFVCVRCGCIVYVIALLVREYIALSLGNDWRGFKTFIRRDQCAAS